MEHGARLQDEHFIMTSSNGHIFRVIGPLGGEPTDHRWIPPHKGQWRGALVISLICACTNDYVNNRDACDLRRHRAHSDVTVMYQIFIDKTEPLRYSRFSWVFATHSKPSRRMTDFPAYHTSFKLANVLESFKVRFPNWCVLLYVYTKFPWARVSIIFL